MLAAAKALGAPLDSYLDRQHPVQLRIRDAVAEFTGSDAVRMPFGIDGCSAPNPAVPLRAIALSLARLGASDDPAAKQVVEAMAGNPFLVGGSDRFDTRLMEVSGGRIVAKGGAAGLQVVLDRRSRQGLALKLESGDGAYIAAAVLRAMAGLRWLDEGEEQALASFARPKLRNHRRIEVGTVEPVFEVRL
jgi:L-asparaginase II